MIASRAEIMVWLGKADSATNHEEALVAMVHPLVEQAVKDFVGYQIEQATYTHYLPERSRELEPDPRLWDYDAAGGRVLTTQHAGSRNATELLLPELPVRSVTTLYEDSGAYGDQGATDFASSTLLTEGTHFWRDVDASGLGCSGILHRIGSYWPARSRTVKVTYTAGYTQAELSTGIASAIKLAVLKAIQKAFTEHGEGQGQVKSERLGDYAVTYAAEGAGELPRESKKLLRKFFRWGRVM